MTVAVSTSPSEIEVLFGLRRNWISPCKTIGPTKTLKSCMSLRSPALMKSTEKARKRHLTMDGLYFG